MAAHAEGRLDPLIAEGDADYAAGRASPLLRSIPSTLFDESIRIEKIIWLAANLDQPNRDLAEFLEEEEPADFERLLGFVPKDQSDRDRSDTLEELSRRERTGFLVEAATPIPQGPIRGENSFMHLGFGCYTTRWFYTEALDEGFVADLLQWKRDYIEARRQLQEGGPK